MYIATTWKAMDHAVKQGMVVGASCINGRVLASVTEEESAK